jgi:hypothetical protein
MIGFGGGASQNSDDVSNATSGPSAGGDPYIYPLIGPAVKLPNVEQVYRLYQDTDIVVNARVKQASQDIQSEIRQVVQDSGLCATMTEAYFFSHIFIGSRKDPDDHVVVDLEQKVTSGNSATFVVDAPILDTTSCRYETMSNSHVSIPIRWGEKMCLMIRFSRNPQVRNGLTLNGGNLEDGTGLLIRNYRPRFFQLTRLDDTSAVKIPRNCRRLTTTRGTKASREISMQFTKQERAC